jgi:hypothetical protein
MAHFTTQSVWSLPHTACCLIIWLALSPLARAEPATQPSTQPLVGVAAVDTPTGTWHRYLRAIDASDRKAALDCWNAVDPKEAKIAELQVDMTSAVARLKKAVRAKIGDAAPFDLQMAVVSEDECGAIKEQITDTSATVNVASIDEQQPARTYSMVRTAGRWRLSAAEELKHQPANAPFDAVLAAGKRMVTVVESTADAVEKGQLKSTDEVQRKISESMGGP